MEKLEYRQRVLLFVAGGMTYSEMRSAYQISERLGKDVYIGSSHTFTPESFVEVMKHFGKAGARDAASRGGPTQYQQQPQQHHHDQLPAGASKLSKPLNDRSAIRTTSLQHGAMHSSQMNGGSHQTGYASPTSAVDQSTYDRRFQTHAPPPQQHQQHQQQGQGQVQQASSVPAHLAAPDANGRSSSPAPSQASDLSLRSKEKKRLKNVFGFKKG